MVVMLLSPVVIPIMIPVVILIVILIVIDRDTRLTMILKLINDDNNITTKQLSLLCNVSQITIKRDIEKLKKQNKLKRIGSERTGYWEIINDK